MELLLALGIFCAVTLFTPGPNNLMLMTSGLNFGFRRGVPLVLGISLGFPAMVLVVGGGLGALFQAWPVVYSVLKYVGAAYLVFLAYQIATSVPATPGGESKGSPIGFFRAAAFQWINPKCWMMAVGAVSTYAAVARFPLNVLLMALLFGVLGIASSVLWLGLGTGLQRLLRAPRAIRVFNVVMALVLVASLYPIFSEAVRGKTH